VACARMYPVELNDTDVPDVAGVQVLIVSWQ
jgi:hypothetical protein